MKSFDAQVSEEDDDQVEDQFVLMAGNHEVVLLGSAALSFVGVELHAAAVQTTKQFNHGSKEGKLANQQISTSLLTTHQDCSSSNSTGY